MRETLQTASATMLGATSRRSFQQAKGLRVAVILDSWHVPRWIINLVKSLSDSEGVQLAWMIRKSESSPRRYSPDSLRTVLFRAWSSLDTRLFKSSAGDANEFVIVNAQSHALPGSKLESTEQALKLFQPDVILNLGCLLVEGKILDCALYGIWSFDECQSHPLSLFWNAYYQKPVSEITLRMSDLNGSRVVERYFFTTDFISPSRSQNNTGRWKTEAVKRAILRLQSGGKEFIRSLESDAEPKPEGRSVGLPGNSTMVRFLTSWTTRAIRNFVRNRFAKEHWFIGFRRARGNGSLPGDMKGFTLITPPPDRFYADPFVIEKSGKNYVFFEEYRFDRAKGVISLIELGQNGEWSQPVVVLERDYHLSYPTLLQWRDEVYLLVESAEAKTVEMYRAEEFPNRWLLERRLMDNVYAVDPTIFCHDGKWWLFTGGLAEPYSTNSELFLFFSSSPDGYWKPHPKNPVITDIRCARPAGQVFSQNGLLIRPGQDCSRLYGYGVSFSRIDLLSETEYRETPVACITPDWLPGNLGTHTFNQNDYFQVIDGRRLISRFSKLAGTIFRNAKSA
jgi:hypothetical protein